MNGWFQVDKAGLAALTARRDKSFIFAELLSNAWDADGATSVTVTAQRVPGKAEAVITVVDDSPDGFSDLAHAFTLFAHTDKRANPAQRGRFNLGEKLCLALAREARIISTRGMVQFDGSGRSHRRTRRATGSEITLRLAMTGAELDQAIAAAMEFIAPIPTTINGAPIRERAPLATTAAKLPTELTGEDGQMRRTERQCELLVYPAHTHDGGRLFELGIPVCATGDSFDVDIRQKVPLSLERESVTDAYLRRVRAAVLACTAAVLDETQAAAAWVTQALEASDVPREAVAAVMQQRFGDKAVVFDPSDPEANKLAVASGYTVVHGGAFSGAAWDTIREAQALLPAGQVTPSPKPWAEGGQVVSPIEPSPAMVQFARWCRRMARKLLGTDISVTFYPRFNNRSAAAYAPGQLQFNVGKLGAAWFEGAIDEDRLDLLLHEFGHHFEGDHLSHRFADALTRLGAKLALAVREDPTLLDCNAA